MQTFLPFSDYAASAACLDTRRLGKQVLEVAQMLRALETGTGFGAHHPATLAWRGCEASLAMYGRACLAEHRKRTGGNGYAAAGELFDSYPETDDKPAWLSSLLESSHRGHLYRKDPQHYERFRYYHAIELTYPVTDGDRFCYVERTEGGFVGVGLTENNYSSIAKTAKKASVKAYWF